MMEQQGIRGLGDDLHTQRDFLVTHVPVYARLLDALDTAQAGAFGQALDRAWSSRSFSSFYERPLLLLASLRYDAMAEGPAHPLHAAIVQDPPDEEAVTSGSVAEAVDLSHERFWRAVQHRHVQTNETTRAVAWLWPAHLLARHAQVREVALVDLGASAGLNLIAGELPFLWTDGTGLPLELAPLPAVTLRLGLDLNPLDACDDDAASWLRACVWPGQGRRLARLNQAIEVFRARSKGPEAVHVERCALPQAGNRLKQLPEKSCVLAVQTIVRDYLTASDRAAHAESMKDWIGSRPPGSALWIEFELAKDAGDPQRSIALTAHLIRSNGRPLDATLARTHPHPKQLWIDPAQLEAFVAALSWRAFKVE